MDKQPEIINRVAQSSLVTIDLEELYHQGERIIYDIADNLFQGIVLKEKEFREFVKQFNWEQYRTKGVCRLRII